MSEDIELDTSERAMAAISEAFNPPTLTDQLRELAEARVRLSECQVAESVCGEAARETSEWQVWQQALARRREQENSIANLESDVRVRACEAFGETGIAKPAEGISIRLFTTLAYDLTAVTNWCRGIMPGLLMLDTKRFERMAREDLLPGAPVEIIKEPRATIATDLSAYLDA